MKTALFCIFYGCLGTWTATFSFLHGHGFGVIVGMAFIALAVMLAMIPDDEPDPGTGES